MCATDRNPRFWLLSHREPVGPHPLEMRRHDLLEQLQMFRQAGHRHSGFALACGFGFGGSKHTRCVRESDEAVCAPRRKAAPRLCQKRRKRGAESDEQQRRASSAFSP